MKILFVHYGFETGGICNSLINFLSFLNDKDHTVHLLVLNGEVPQNVDLPDNIILLDTPQIVKSCFLGFQEMRQEHSLSLAIGYFTSRFLNKIIGKRKTAELYSRFGKLHDEYDIAIAFANDIYSEGGSCIKCGCNQFVKKAVRASIKVAWIHAMATQIGYKKPLIASTYDSFDKIVNCNNACKEIFDAIVPQYKEKSIVINNVLDEKTIQKKAFQETPYSKEVFNIVTVARIENKTKRLDRIPEIMSHLVNRNGLDNLRWHIIGDGPDRDSLEKQIIASNVEKYVILHGEKHNPYPFIKFADLYVQTSDYEAMPLVVMESEILGTPVISTNYPAAKEMIPNNCGTVVDSTVDALVKAIAGYICDDNLRLSNVSLKQSGYDQFMNLLLDNNRSR